MLFSLGTLGIALSVTGGVVGGVDKYNRHKREVEREKKNEERGAKLDGLIQDLEKKAHQ